MPFTFIGRAPLARAESDAALDEAAAFYDRTITAAWRLALRLHHGDAHRASDAVVDAYRVTWQAGPNRRDQAWLLHALVTRARDSLDSIPA